MKNDNPDCIPISVVMRSYNDAALLPRTLAALDAQQGVEIELAVFESASSDDSPAILERHGYERIEHLKPGTYRSSRVLNQGARDASNEVVVFLNSDAVLIGPDVLRTLAERLLASEKTAGVFARQTVREDAGFMTRMEYEQAFDRRDEMGRAASWMTLVCSAIRRSVWEQVAFDERLTFAEDAVWSESVAQLGYETCYLSEVAAEHSHDYSWEQRYRRAFGDAAALAALPNAKHPGGWLGAFFIPWLKRTAKLSLHVCAKLQPWRVPQIVLHLWPLMRGAWQGSAAGWQAFHSDDPPADEQPVV